MATVLEVPSGMIGEVRALLVDDADKMSDQSVLYDQRHVLRDSWKVLDPGPYTGEKFDWPKVVFCDRWEIMLWASILTHGDLYRFRYPCKNPDGACQHAEGGNRPHPIPWRLKLSELKRKPMPEETRQKLAAGTNRFETMAVIGDDWSCMPSRVVFKLLDEETEVATVKRIEGGLGRKQRNRILARAQILQVGNIDEPAQLDRLIGGLNIGMLEQLRERMDEHDGGVVTNIRIHCDRCGWEEEIDLPLGGLFKKRLRPFPWEDPKEAAAAMFARPPVPKGFEGRVPAVA